MSRTRPWKQNVKAQQKAIVRASYKTVARDRQEYLDKKARNELPALEDAFRDIYESCNEKYREAGLLLQQIKDRKPWKLLKDPKTGQPEYPTFGAYCQIRLRFDKRQANHIIRGAKTANILGPPYPRNEGIVRKFERLVEADPVLARAARDKLYSVNPNPTGDETLDFLRNYLTDDEASAFLPPAPQPKTVAVCQRRMEREIAKFLSDLPGKHRPKFLSGLYFHVREAMYLSYGLERAKPGHQVVDFVDYTVAEQLMHLQGEADGWTEGVEPEPELAAQ